MREHVLIILMAAVCFFGIVSKTSVPYDWGGLLHRNFDAVIPLLVDRLKLIVLGMNSPKTKKRGMVYGSQSLCTALMQGRCGWTKGRLDIFHIIKIPKQA